MILRMKANELSSFSGYLYEDYDNEELDKYIDVFLRDSEFCRFDIEDSTGRDIHFHTICYIKDRLKNCTMFTQTILDDNGKPIMYRLCFYKEKIND